MTSAVAARVTTRAATVWIDDWIAAGGANLTLFLGMQRWDGSWLYAADGLDAFIEDSRTCFVLKNLAESREKTQRCQLRDSLVSGHAFCETALLDCGGLPKSFTMSWRPSLVLRELHDIAEGINLALLRPDHDSDPKAIRPILVEALLRRWQFPYGRSVTRATLLGMNTVLHRRWGQHQVPRALALTATEGCVAV